VAVEPIGPVGPRPDLAGVERLQLTPEQRREREQRRRKRREATPKPPGGKGRGGLDLRA